MHWTRSDGLALLLSYLPRLTGEVARRAGRGKATVEMSENFRSEIFESLSVALPLPTLPRMTGEEKKGGKDG